MNDLNRSANLSEEDLDSLANALEKYDVEGTGLVNIAEFKKYLEKVSEKKYSTVINVLSECNIDLISTEDFIDLLNKKFV